METLKKARNTFYLNYYIGIAEDQTEFVLPFPDMVQNIKANNALISVDSVELTSIDAGDNSLVHIPELIFNTSIPSSTTFVQMVDDTVPRTTTYAEAVQFTAKCVSSTTSTEAGGVTTATEEITGLGYKNSNPNRVYLVPNPFGNKYTCSWTDARKGVRQLYNLIKAKAFNLVLKVELIEEEIFR